MDKPKTVAEKTTKTTVDTIGFTVKEAQAWVIPGDIQRAVKVNKNVMELAIQIKNDGGVIPGILTLGVLEGKTYLIDGQQRREAFFISEKDYGYADVRTCFFKTRADMGDEFVRLNSALVKMTPDDILRGMECSHPLLHRIRSACPFVGYGRVRIGNNPATMLSMSATLRCWAGSRREAPGPISTSSKECARELQEEEVRQLVSYLQLAFSAWAREEVNYRLWSALNLTITMWLYRRTVVAPATTYDRADRINDDLFRKCLISLSADRHYMDWLLGRNASEKFRAPCYTRIKDIFSKRIHQETGRKYKFLQPAWSTH